MSSYAGGKILSGDVSFPDEKPEKDAELDYWHYGNDDDDDDDDNNCYYMEATFFPRTSGM
jgi:hypothetical protein